MRARSPDRTAPFVDSFRPTPGGPFDVDAARLAPAEPAPDAQTGEASFAAAGVRALGAMATWSRELIQDTAEGVRQVVVRRLSKVAPGDNMAQAGSSGVA